MISVVKQSLLVNTCKVLQNVHRVISNFKPDWDYLTNPENVQEIANNIQIRKGVGDIVAVHRLLSTLQSTNSKEKQDSLKKRIDLEMLRIPNKTHPNVRPLEDPKDIQYYNHMPNFPFKPNHFHEIAQKNKLLRMEHLSNFTGHKSYYLMADLAELEQALIAYTIERLEASSFELISVPDILPAKAIEGCGFSTSGERNQVYKLNDSDLCLSGTSEMALAAFFSNKTTKIAEAPVKRIALSRCFRAETSGLQEEKGIYRVHQFNKVEMFAVTKPEESEKVLEEFKEIQIKLFQDLGLHFKLLDMPPHELGAPAYRKYDIETWMCGRGIWGEISSCSNCTDYQSRRLNMKILKEDGAEIFAHTINGTACAVPRMLIAILEMYQNQNGSVSIPEALIPYIGHHKIEPRKAIPALKLIKSVSSIIR